jgi:hypothetical protein
MFLIALAFHFLLETGRAVLVSLFTIGHTMALLLSVFWYYRYQNNVVEFLIPITF